MSGTAEPPGLRDALVVGDINLDVLVRPQRPVERGTDVPAEVLLRPGGAAANVAVGLGRLGVATTLVGCVGETDAGWVTRLVRSAGVALSVRTVSSTRTGAVVATIDPDGERSMASDRGANLALSEADLPASLIAGHRHLHVSGYALLHAGPRAAARTAIGRALAAGRTVSVDPASLAPLRAYGVADFRADIEGIHVLTPNAAEALALSGQADVAQAARELATAFPVVAISCGAGGAVWADQGGVIHRPLAVGSAQVVDTTGAGDAFTAGLLAAWLAGRDPAGCLDAGLAAAAQVVTRLGGQ